MKMRIIELDSISPIVKIHEIVFGTSFPYDSYVKKSEKYRVFIYGYYEDQNIVGYSLVVAQDEEKNLYAWYGGLIPAFQGQGITIDFFNLMVEKAIELGYSSISLATTNCRPNMIRLAIKYGFDIYDLKKRDYGEGNKIYFKYYIYSPTVYVVNLTKDDGSKLKVPELERTLVGAYKHNCIKIVFDGIESEEDLKAIIYAKRYCQKFLRKISFEFKGNSNIIELLEK